ncbi:hypothetical protein ES705_38930 [subsurface metagenome]
MENLKDSKLNVKKVFKIKFSKVFLLSFVVLTIGILLCNSAIAETTIPENTKSTVQSYNFEVPTMTTNITVLKDGSIDIYYTIVFKNLLGADSIDIVDIGFPNHHYEINSVRAWIDDIEIFNIQKSTYIEIGPEIHLDAHAILPNHTAVLVVYCHNPVMVFPDENEGYASLLFDQTWFSSNFASGTTNRIVRIFLPGEYIDLSVVEERLTTSGNFTIYDLSPSWPYVEIMLRLLFDGANQ